MISPYNKRTLPHEFMTFNDHFGAHTPTQTPSGPWTHLELLIVQASRHLTHAKFSGFHVEFWGIMFLGNSHFLVL